MRLLFRGFRRRPRARRARHARSRLLAPGFYLRAVVLLAGGGLVVLPWTADGLGLAAGARSPEGCRVARVIDGDTVSLWCPGRGLRPVRLLGFDTPELSSPRCAAEYARAQAAAWHLRWLLLTGGGMTLDFAGTDRYGRQLAEVSIDGQPLAGAMIAAGHARPYAGGPRQEWCA